MEEVSPLNKEEVKKAWLKATLGLLKNENVAIVALISQSYHRRYEFNSGRIRADFRRIFLDKEIF
jgi:hypothetical protein